MRNDLLAGMFVAGMLGATVISANNSGWISERGNASGDSSGRGRGNSYRSSSGMKWKQRHKKMTRMFIAQLKESDPARYEELQKLKESDPKKFHEEAKKIFTELKEKKIAERKAFQKLITSYQENPTDENMALVKTELKERLQRRLNREEKRIEMFEEKINEAKVLLEKRRANIDKIIANKIDTLKVDPDLEW